VAAHAATSWHGAGAMDTGRDRLINPRRRLPDLALADRASGTSTSVHPRGRRAPVLVLVHGSGCVPCRAHLQSLAEFHPSIDEWDGHVVAVSPDPPAPAGAPHDLELPFALLSDPAGHLATALRTAHPATVIADQWGEIHELRSAGPAHRFLTPIEIVEWARFLAVQCPECQGESL
jgi:peroxiredoxin